MASHKVTVYECMCNIVLSLTVFRWNNEVFFADSLFALSAISELPLGPVNGNTSLSIHKAEWWVAPPTISKPRLVLRLELQI